MSDIRRDPSSEPVEQTPRVDERPPVAGEDATTHADVREEATTHADVREEATTHADAPHAEERRIDRDPSSEQAAPSTAPGDGTGFSAEGGLLSDDDLGGYKGRWDEIQVQFIDEPRQSVRQADDLVGEVTRQIAERFTGFRRDFEQRWEGGNEPTTEELRLALQRYRDFFQRLVAR